LNTRPPLGASMVRQGVCSPPASSPLYGSARPIKGGSNVGNRESIEGDVQPFLLAIVLVSVIGFPSGTSRSVALSTSRSHCLIAPSCHSSAVAMWATVRASSVVFTPSGSLVPSYFSQAAQKRSSALWLSTYSSFPVMHSSRPPMRQFAWRDHIAAVTTTNEN
jgi:hypothetical protein